MLRASRLFAATLAAISLALPAMADARVVSASVEARFTVVATCSVNVARPVAKYARVNVDCASAKTPYLLDTASAPSLRSAGPDAQRVTVYF